jgi:mannose-6-phosphate isomerase
MILRFLTLQSRIVIYRNCYPSSRYPGPTNSRSRLCWFRDLAAALRQKTLVSVECEVKALAIEHARAHTSPKPWGIVDLRPWSDTLHDGRAIGEIRYERPGSPTADTSLLLKLLFTSQPLSIQVHPDDAYAQSIGLQNGKTEAWYVLSAAPEAKVALGLKRCLTPKQLRQAGEDGSITDLVVWHAVSQGDSIFVPAGTIHAIGAGLVIAEIQQRSDATFRLFDHGRQRELHIENAISVANAGPAEFRVIPTRLTDTRTLLISNTHFTFERIDLPPNSDWCLEAEHETWLLVINGGARTESFNVVKGDAVFAQSDRVDMHIGTIGMVALVAYTGVVLVADLLQRPRQPDARIARRLQEVPGPASLGRATAPTDGYMETVR